MTTKTLVASKKSLSVRFGLWLAGGVALAALAGCGTSGLQAVSSGYTGCSPQEIEISNDNVGWSWRSWTASCRGVVYTCSGAGQTMSCKRVGEQRAQADEKVEPGQPEERSGGDAQTSLGIDTDGSLRAEMDLAPKGKVRLLARPSHSSKVLVQLIPSGSVEDCDGARIVSDGIQQPVKLAPKGGSTAVQLVVTPSVVSSVAYAEHDAAFLLCGEKWNVTESERALMGRFLERFQERAEAYGQGPSEEASEAPVATASASEPAVPAHRARR